MSVATSSSGLVHVPDPPLVGTSCVVGSLPACSCAHGGQVRIARETFRELARRTFFMDGKFTGRGTASFVPAAPRGRCMHGVCAHVTA